MDQLFDDGYIVCKHCYYYRPVLSYAIERYFIILIKTATTARLVSFHEIFAVQAFHVHRMEFLVHVYTRVVLLGRIMTRIPIRNIRSLSFYLSSHRCVFDTIIAWAEETMIRSFFLLLLHSITSSSPVVLFLLFVIQ